MSFIHSKLNSEIFKFPGQFIIACINAIMRSGLNQPRDRQRSRSGLVQDEEKALSDQKRDRV